MTHPSKDLQRGLAQTISHEHDAIHRLRTEVAAIAAKLDTLCATLERIERLLAERPQGG